MGDGLASANRVFVVFDPSILAQEAHVAAVVLNVILSLAFVLTNGEEALFG